MNILDQDLEVDVNLYFKTIVITKERIVAGKCVNVNVVRETCFVYCKMINSVKAFLIGKQKAVKITEMKKMSIHCEKNEEDELFEAQKNAEL